MTHVKFCSNPMLIKEALIGEQLDEPLVFDGFINHWEARTWSPESLSQCSDLADKRIIFRVDEEITGPQEKRSKTDVLWENESSYISCTLRDFIQYADGDRSDVSDYEPSGDQALDRRRHLWAYADYKHMHELFTPEMSEAIDWEVFGFEGRDGTASTFWLGSAGAHTPCHYDTYGCNLVAQLYGRKKWVMFPPSDTRHLYPTRIPFEESSVFSKVNIKAPCSTRFPKYANAHRYEVVLEPGQVLYVPKHWWHYVECLTTAISVNTWIDLESDKEERVSEALACMLTKSISDYSGTPSDQVYNPKEAPMECEEGLSLLNAVLTASNDPVKDTSSQRRTEHQRNSAVCVCCKRTINPLKPAISEQQLENSPKSQSLITAQSLIDAVTHPEVLKLMKSVLEDRVMS